MGLVVYPGSGSVDGQQGDHVMVGPPFCISDGEIRQMVQMLENAAQAAVSSISKDEDQVLWDD